MTFSCTRTEAENIRLIASDIDGTLLPEGTSGLPDEMFDIIRQLKEKNIYFAAASGRGYSSVRKLFAPVLQDIYFLVENGSLAMARDRVLFARALPGEILEELVQYVRTLPPAEVDFWMLSGAEKQYTEVINEELLETLESGYGVMYERMEDVLTADDPTILKCAVHTTGDATGLGAAMQELFGDRVSIAVSGAHWVDCNPKGTNKGEGLQWLGKELGVSFEETMAFGDNTNDIPMLQNAAYSFAVEEGRPETKEAARFSAGSMDEGGVLQILKDLLASLK